MLPAGAAAGGAGQFRSGRVGRSVWRLTGEARRRVLPAVVVGVAVAAALVAAPSSASGSPVAPAAVVPGHVYSWGRNNLGEIDPTLPVGTGRLRPALVSGLPGGVRQVVGGADVSYGLLSDGTVWAWGDNQAGE